MFNKDDIQEFIKILESKKNIKVFTILKLVGCDHNET